MNGAFVYMLFGLAMGPVGLGVLDLSISKEGIRTVAELTLALVLFTDASSADLRVLRRTVRLPQRLLLPNDWGVLVTSSQLPPRARGRPRPSPSELI